MKKQTPVSISTKNSKVPCSNVSMTPILSCCHDAPCRKHGQCYACRSLRYPSCRAAWRKNYDLAITDRALYFDTIRQTMIKRAARGETWFRWHVSGDILDQDYLNNMVRIARELPNVRFLAFTKMHKLNFRQIPSNLKIVFSYWPGWGKVTRRFPAAYMQDGTEKRVPSAAWQCPGNCDGCMACWNLKPGESVVFNKH